MHLKLFHIISLVIDMHKDSLQVWKCFHMLTNLVYNTPGEYISRNCAILLENPFKHQRIMKKDKITGNSKQVKVISVYSNIPYGAIKT